MAMLLNHIEEADTCIWPEAFVTASITLLPKGEGPDPIKQRPITVFPFIYRAYASLRYEDTQAWQDSWATPEVYGAVPNRVVADASWMLALDVEKAVLKSEDLYVALLDNSKYFDYFLNAIFYGRYFCTWVHQGGS